MGMAVGLSHWGRNRGWGCSRIGYWERYLALRQTRKQDSGEDCIMRSVMICTPLILSGQSYQEEWEGQGTWHIQATEENTMYWWGSIGERGYLEDLRISRRRILKWIFKMWERRARTGLVWLRTRTSGGPLWIKYWTSWFQRVRVNSSLAEDLLGSKGGLRSIYLVD